MIYPEIKTASIISVGEGYLGKYEIMELLVSKQARRFNYSYDKNFQKTGDLPDNGIFIETGKPGIQKSLRKQKGQKDQGFYKQYSYAFHDDAGFTFYAEIDRDIAKNFASGRITLGGEKSAFHMVIDEYTETGSPFDGNSAFYSGLYERPHTSLHKIVCLSDCVVIDQLSENITFMSNAMIEFRNSRSKVAHTAHYSRMDKKFEDKFSQYVSPVRSQKYQLLKKGSVLWVNDQQVAAVKTLLDKPQCQAVGYNYFKNIPKQ